MRVDLNCDVGECADSERLTLEAQIIPLVSSVSIACGFHAGSHDLMRHTIRLARTHGVSVGAHPGFFDREGFGRRDMALTPEEIETLIAYQVGALIGIATLEGVRVVHVKPHGALYNMAVRDPRLAEAIALATAAVDPSLILVGLPGSQLIEAGRRAGLRTANEAFADRGYRADGTLVPRDAGGSVIHDIDIVTARAVSMVRDHSVEAVDGTRVVLHVDTICVHGDTPGAAMLARRIRDALTTAKIELQPLFPQRAPA
jgi:UPF0271 protein